MRNSADLSRFAADLGPGRCHEQCQQSRDSTIVAIGAGPGSMVDMAVEEQEKEIEKNPSTC